MEWLLSQPRVGEDWSVSVSILLQYPQYQRSDCIQEANEKDLLVEHLAEARMPFAQCMYVIV